MANHLERLAFIDETSVKTNMAKTTGWAPRGQRLVDHAPFGHWRAQTFVGALRHDRMDAPWVIDGAMNGEMFDLSITTQLAPTLRNGDVLRRDNDPPDHFLILLILDSLSSHKGPAAARALHAIGAWFRCSGKTVHRTLFFSLQPPALQPGPQSYRYGICQAQDAAPESCRPNLRSAMARGRTRLRSVHRRSMP